jgi:uncharacterized protein YjbI with pentapeptide repeats
VSKAWRSPGRPKLPSSVPRLEEPPTERESSWEASEIRGDLSRRCLESLDVSGCRLFGVDLTLATLEGCRIRDSVLVDCELSGAALEAVSLSRVELRRCRVTGAILSRGHLRDVRFVECAMEEVQLRMADGLRVLFDACRLTDADFYGSTFEQTCFFDCDLTHADFSQAALRGGRLHGSTLERVRGIQSLAGVTISAVQAVPLALQLLATFQIEVDDERPSAL